MLLVLVHNFGFPVRSRTEYKPRGCSGVLGNFKPVKSAPFEMPHSSLTDILSRLTLLLSLASSVLLSDELP